MTPWHASSGRQPRRSESTDTIGHSTSPTVRPPDASVEGATALPVVEGRTPVPARGAVSMAARPQRPTTGIVAKGRALRRLCHDRPMTRTMTAAVTLGVGGPEMIDIRQVPVPEPGPGEVRVAVLAAGMNNTDVNTRLGWYSSSVTGSTDD